MEPEVRYTLVGAALLGLVLALGLMMVWLTRGGASADLRYYTIHFEHASLEGAHRTLHVGEALLAAAASA